MFTIKFYSGDGCRQIIREAESFTILRSPSGSVHDITEVTLHQKGGEGCRIDVGDECAEREEGWPALFAKAIIENASGRTTEMIGRWNPAKAPAPTL